MLQQYRTASGPTQELAFASEDNSPTSFFSPCISFTYGFCASDGCQGNSPGNRVLLYPHSCARLLSGLCSELNIIPAYSTQTPLTSPSAETSPGDHCLCTAAGKWCPASQSPSRQAGFCPALHAALSPGSPRSCKESRCKQHRCHRLLWLIKPGLYRENTRITGNRKPKLL